MSEPEDLNKFPETSDPVESHPVPETPAAGAPTDPAPAEAPQSEPVEGEPVEGEPLEPQTTPTAPLTDTPTDTPEPAPENQIPEPPVSLEDASAVLADSRRRTRRSFLAAGVSAAAGYGFYHWIGTSRREGDQPMLLRKAYQVNAELSRAVFEERALAPTYPLRRAQNLRVNGVFGIQKALVPDSWRLQVAGVADAAQRPGYTRDLTAWKYKYAGDDDPDAIHYSMDGDVSQSRTRLASGTPGLLLTIDDLLKFPRHELVDQFKCIEGWSEIVHWAGVRMADFLEAYPPERINGREPRYVYMETPDGAYYTGYNIAACRHPQTLLVTEMMGQPISQWHGAPLRLHMPIKYGYKQIKRVALIRYMDQKPDDYWTRLGYDWYAGL
jgi:hypothetical protein